MPFNFLEHGTVPRADPWTALEAGTKPGLTAFAAVCKRRIRSPSTGVRIRQIANPLLEKFDPVRRLLLLLGGPKPGFLLALRPAKLPRRSTEHVTEMTC